MLCRSYGTSKSATPAISASDISGEGKGTFLIFKLKINIVRLFFAFFDSFPIGGNHNVPGESAYH